MAPTSHPFTLLPFLAPGPVHSIAGEVMREAGTLRLRFLLQGDLARLQVPPARPPAPADELWRHTCFEAFVARPGEEGYLEFNFSPSGQWAAYAFGRYRERAPELPPFDPRVTVQRAADRLQLEAAVPLATIAPRYAGGPLRLNLSTVVETSDGAIEYWALRHPAAKPDFHHPDAFVLELDEIRH